MKQAKFALTAVALLAVIGGALAFKANRVPLTFYKYTTSIVNDKVTGICDENQSFETLLKTTAAGGTITTVSIAPASNVTTCTARVTAGL